MIYTALIHSLEYVKDIRKYHLMKFSKSGSMRQHARVGIKLALVVAGLYLTSHEVLFRIDWFIERSEWFYLAVMAGIWFTAVAALLFVSFSTSAMVRIIWATPILISTFLGDLYYRIAENRLTYVALEAMFDAATPDPGILIFYSSYMLQSVTGTMVLGLGMLLPPFRVRLGCRPYGLLPAIPLLLLSVLVYIFAGQGGNETRGMPTQFHPLALVGVYALTSSSAPHKSPVEISLKTPPAARHVLLIIDESVSGDFIDLNHSRGTTPFLESRRKDIANFGLTTSASNCSHLSNAVLRLGANPDKLGARGYSVMSNPSVWKYAKKAGFETNHIDVQSIFATLQDFSSSEELELIDHHRGFEEKNDYNDIEAAAMVVEILNRSSPQFILVNKAGTHFPYEERYPADKTVFSPTMGQYESIGNRERLVNSYKNAVRWSVDHFFEQLLTQTVLDDTVLIYTADHGQNLLDNGGAMTHCGQVPASLNEVSVPLFAMTGENELAGKLAQAASLNFDKASHFEIFPTLLVLFGFDPSEVSERYHPSLFDPIAVPMGITTGVIMDRLGVEPRWYDRDDLETLHR